MSTGRSAFDFDRDGSPDELVAPSVRAADDGAVVVDPIERRRMPLRTPAPVEPVHADPGAFPVPVDAAASFDAASVTLPYGVLSYVRAPDGTARGHVEGTGSTTLPAAGHLVELSGPVKAYLRVDAPVEVEVAPDRTTVAFGGETAVVVGVRSYHSRPAATVATTADPRDVMAVVSTFGAALKTTSPERSYPTLRGHPPLVELGDDLRVPDGLEPPDTGVTVEMPDDLQAVCVAAPLAYYLGAAVEPGDPPRVVADGFEHRFESPVEIGVERTLQRAFLLDCVARTEGWYRMPLVERDAVEPHLDRDLADLYDAPVAERLDAAFALPADAVADAVPEWPLVADVTDDAANVAALPQLANELAVVRAASDAGAPDPGALPVDVAGFVRAGTGGHLPRPRVDPPAADALAQVRVGDGTPLAGGTLLPVALRNRLARDPDDGDLAVTVVCNDGDMAGEYDGRLYRGRGDVPLDVTVHRDCTVDGLRATLADDASFLHYVGHVEPDGLVCADGTLDAASLDAVGVETFLLNGCRSYAQGVALVEAGAIGGIVTVSDVANDHATALGRTVARLLDAGFSLRAALSVADRERGRYVTVGDAGVAVTQSDGGLPNVLRVDVGDDAARVAFRTHPTTTFRAGSLFRPYADGVDAGTLVGSTSAEATLSPDALRELLAMEELPVILDGDLTWSSAVDVDAFYGPG